jgi:N-acetylglucosaminyldiphosphoundecaprenol N-acetyl-beta-D-mannosaminyltransferase
METTAIPLPKTCDILGRRVAITTYDEAVALARVWALRRDRAYAIDAANTHVVALARHDADFGRAMEKIDILLPDGMPLIWCINRKTNEHLRDRVYGPTFMLRCIAVTEGELSHFLLGGSQELLDVLQKKLREKFPKLQIADAYAPPFGTWPDDEDAHIIDRIEKSGAHFVWVGLGCPRQELWIAKNKERLPNAVFIGIGAAFAFHAGRVKQAPAWMQNSGFEWFFRLLAEPRRLWKRYVVYNTLFLFYLVFKPARTHRLTHE